MQAIVRGDAFPVLDFTLQPGERLLAEPGEFSWMSSNIRMETSTKVAGASSLFGILKRAMGGGGFFMTTFSAQGFPGQVSFAAKIPGQIIPVQVTPQNPLLVHRHGFVCGTEGIELSISFQRSFGAGLFGGSGFALQKISGLGEVWIEIGGQLIERNLTQGEEILVHPGHVGMFESTIEFNITRISGIRNMVFGGNGLFVASLRGPGKVWLQSLTLPNLAHALSPYLGENATTRVEEAGIGGIAGSLLHRFFS